MNKENKDKAKILFERLEYYEEKRSELIGLKNDGITITLFKTHKSSADFMPKESQFNSNIKDTILELVNTKIEQLESEIEKL